MTNKIVVAIKCEMRSTGTVAPETTLHNLHLRGIKTPSLRTVYNYIHKGALGFNASWLPYSKRHRRKQRREKRVGIFNREGSIIDDIPKEQLNREKFGTLEMDTVVSRQGQLQVK